MHKLEVWHLPKDTKQTKIRRNANWIGIFMISWFYLKLNEWDLFLFLRDISVEHCSKKLVKTQRALVHHVSVANCGLTGLALLIFEASCAAHCGPKTRILFKNSNNPKFKLLWETRSEYYALEIGHYQKDEFWEFLNRFISFSSLCGAAVASSGDDTMHDSEVEVWAPNEIQGDAKIL